jgi:hypothetical protein
MPNHVKAANTKTTVEKSQADIIATLRRYGASGFGFRKIGDIVEVTFHMFNEAKVERTVIIPLSVDTVHKKLQAMRSQRSYTAHKVAREQAERVAWRVLLDWIDAALLAVSVGAQTIEEAFFAHSVIVTSDGQTGRLVDYVHTLEQATGGEAGSGKLPNPGRPLLQLVAGDKG